MVFSFALPNAYSPIFFSFGNSILSTPEFLNAYAPISSTASMPSTVLSFAIPANRPSGMVFMPGLSLTLVYPLLESAYAPSFVTFPRSIVPVIANPLIDPAPSSVTVAGSSYSLVCSGTAISFVISLLYNTPSTVLYFAFSPFAVPFTLKPDVFPDSNRIAPANAFCANSTSASSISNVFNNLQPPNAFSSTVYLPDGNFTLSIFVSARALVPMPLNDSFVANIICVIFVQPMNTPAFKYVP